MKKIFTVLLLLACSVSCVNPNLLVRPDLVADRTKKQVSFFAETTALSQPEIEFLLVTRNSGHDYEALAISLAEARDIHQALEFIGMKPGRCVDYRKFAFWPKGERVLVSVKDAKKEDSPAVRTENLLADDRTGTTMKEEGFVFTGSIMIENPEEPGKKIYAAQGREPGSIISDYNEPETVLDVPVFAQQDVTYGHLKRRENFPFASNTLLKVIMEPELTNGTTRVKECTLEISPGEAIAEGGDESGVTSKLTLKDADGSILNKKPGVAGLFEAVSSMVNRKQDPFVTLKFADNLRLADVAKIVKIIQNIESPTGIRVEPPAPGHLYYKAFNPNPKYLDRKERMVHPWELRLEKDKKGVLRGKLTQTEMVWKDEDPSNPEYKTIDYPVPTPQSLRKELDDEAARKKSEEKTPNIAVILVIIKPDVTYGELTSFMKAVLSTHSTIHVFLE